MINFGIIGYGFIGHHHKQVINSFEHSNLCGVYDVDPKQTDDLTNDEKAYNSAEELASDPEIDTVIIAVPNHLHLEMVELAAKYKKNIICEKPAAMNLDEYDQMVQAVKQAGVLFTIHHQRRWDEDYRTAKAVLESGKLGNEYLISSSLHGYNGNMHDWHVYKKYGGGMLYDWGVHLIDQMLDMVPNEVDTIYADIRNVINEEVDDYFTILIKFKSGVTGRIELGTYMLGTQEKWYERHWYIGGDEGSMLIDGFAPSGNIVKTSELLTNVPGSITMGHAGPTRSFGAPPEGRIVSEPLPKVNTSHIMFYENYYRAHEGEEELIIKPEQIRKVLKVVELARKSAETNQVVKFDD